MQGDSKARLLANLLLSKGSLQLKVPDYHPPMVAVIRELFGDCTPANLPAILAEQNPVICNLCMKQIGSVTGLSVGVITQHPNCKQVLIAEPPWYKTYGFNMIAMAAFPANRYNAELLVHYLIKEYLKNESLIKGETSSTARQQSVQPPAKHSCQQECA